MNSSDAQANISTAVLAGGCFWCLEAVFEEVRGITKVVSGYIDGTTPNPNYEAICTGNSGYAEAVCLTFDPEVVKYAELLEVFFAIHDPTQLNRQGNDVGTQYRSAIFWRDEVQRNIAQAMLTELREKRVFSAPVVTQLIQAPHFYPAEDYHQHYFVRNPNQSYCAYVVAPKLDKFRKTLARLRK